MPTQTTNDVSQQVTNLIQNFQQDLDQVTESVKQGDYYTASIQLNQCKNVFWNVTKAAFAHLKIAKLQQQSSRMGYGPQSIEGSRRRPTAA